MTPSKVQCSKTQIVFNGRRCEHGGPGGEHGWIKGSIFGSKINTKKKKQQKPL